MKQKRKMGRKLIGFLLTLVMVIGLMPGMSLTAYAADVPYANLKDTINVINFDGKEWYLIDYDGDSTVTLLSKECIGASVFNPNEPDDNTYSGSTVENFVNSWYTGNISPDAQAAVSGSGMFLLTEEQASNLSTDVLKCSPASGAYDNHWWLCSKGTTDSSAAMVNGGSGNVSGYSGNVWIAYGVRPALKLDLSKVMFDSDTNTFNIKVDVTGVTLNKTAVTLNVNGTETLTATVSPEDATNNTIIWSSDNTAVATVSDGVVTAVAKGTAIVTATATNGTEDTSDDKSATCTITVEEPQKEEPAPDETKEEETTPVTPATDTSINTEVKTAEGAPAIKADNLDNALAEKLLTDAEKAEYANGTPVLVYLDVKEVDKANVPADDVKAIDKVTSESGYTYGDCLDISLWKKMGDGDATQVHDTNGNPIKMTVTVPASLAAPAGYVRTIRVVRVHGGEAKVLAEGTGLTLDISSDRFSSYFLVYKDTKIEEAINTSADTSSNTQSTPAPAQTTVAEVPKTGEYMPIAALIMLILSMTGMVMVITGLKKKNHI